jgi:cation transport regulator ChaC
MNYLFGYGSLLDANSAARTLQRPVVPSDLQPAIVQTFTRTWTAAVDVAITSEGRTRQETALFLDLSNVADSGCNGALLQVTDAEIAYLDIRERQYERIVVQAAAGERLVAAFTYIVPKTQKMHQGVILEDYIKLINTALHSYSPEFNEAFWKTTAALPRPTVSGTYTFIDSEQNKAVGRK